MFTNFIKDLDAYAFRLGLPKWNAPFMIFLYPTIWAIGVYRFGNWIHRGFDVPIIKQILYIIYFVLKRITEILTSVEIAHKADIGEGLFLGHRNIVIGNSVIGNNASFHADVTIGGAGRGTDHGTPVIGDSVYFGAGAKVIGKLKVGNNVLIAANAVVVKNVPDNAVVGGVPAKVLNYNGSSDYIHFREKV